MQVAPALLEQARVRRFLNEAVAEAVFRSWAAPLLHDEIEPLELGQGRPQPLRGDEPLEQRRSESPPDDGGNRRDLADVRRQTAEPGLERFLDRDRHGGAVAPLDRIPRRLLEEERVAPGALGELRSEVLGQLATRGRGGQSRPLVRIEGVELKLTEAVPVPAARRLAKLPRGQIRIAAIEQEDCCRLLVSKQQELLAQVEGWLVGEVEVLEHEAERPLM